MADSFFEAKRGWSKYKDAILEYYLQPYIPKVWWLKKPILIVDCFAGCGRFGDGQAGSPLIIAPIIKHWRKKGINVSGEFIEADRANFNRLSQALHSFEDCATPRFGTFDGHLDELAARAKDNTVFLYVDPYTVKGLDFSRMNAVFEHIHKSSSSVEVLLNLNVATFMRWALAALKRHDDLPPEATNEEADYQTDDPGEPVELATLDAIAGGDYWRDTGRDPALSFVEKLDAFTAGYCKRLRSSFTYVAGCDIKSRYEHQVPKYMLIYATRHPDGVELMNDGMCKARREFLGQQFKKGLLFDLTPEDEAPDLESLGNELVLTLTKRGQLSRKWLRNYAIWDHFGRYQSKDINSAIGNLLKSKIIHSSTGKTRINDDVRLSSLPFSKT
jgi:three-Cys-motif partner protein